MPGNPTTEELRTLEELNALKTDNYPKWCERVANLNKRGDVRLWNWAIEPKFRPKQKAASEPPPAQPAQRATTQDYVTPAELREAFVSVIKTTAKGTGKFVKEVAEIPLKALAERVGHLESRTSTMADTGAMLEIIAKLEARVINCEKSEAAHRRHLQELEKKIAKKEGG
jgi:hypothetical protein